MLENIKTILTYLKEKYNEVYFSYEYHEDIDMYEIWHNKKELRFDFNFREFYGRLLFENLFSKGFSNVFIDYNEEKSIEMDFLYSPIFHANITGSNSIQIHSLDCFENSLFSQFEEDILNKKENIEEDNDFFNSSYHLAA